MTGGGESRDHWFEDLADHMGEAYLRYSFTKGTVQEVDHIVHALGLSRGDRVLDVGCGPGRHAHELARRGITVHGIDISERFVEIAAAGAPDGATFERSDARSLTFDAEFDAVICLCQGAFGLMTASGEDTDVIDGMARAVRLGGRVALSAFSAYFVAKHWQGADFDADTGVNHEETEIKSETGETKTVDLWTGCYTPRELRMLLDGNGLTVDSISSVEPGAYGFDRPTLDTAEFLVVATRTTSARGR
ncbi:MAG: methyltransferase domain-containing protein [Ilumatobacter sp.]|uniref:class I SAM-dependent methyltransferase n=1 Tax=Ilumatobacter sp. TaxID=1967498 RepID=UPI0032993D48